MKNIFLVTLMTSFALAASAQEPSIECSVTNQTAQVVNGSIAVVGDNLQVPVEIFNEFLPGIKMPPVELSGKKFSVRYFPGSDFEKQTILQMQIGGLTSSIYDVKNSLYQLTLDDVRFQCLVSIKAPMEKL